ncbi:MAG: c-type cytochrome [Xanthobacteraceae bacterium]|nr:c-type cytochrome [Xanthobacteraceae bacterium]
MTIFGLKAMLRTAMTATVLGAAWPAAADDLHAKLEYCLTCHGTAGQGYRAYYTMPRLAGQQPKYIENQLRAFVERRRTNPIMANVAHGLSPSMFGALAEHFHALTPPPLGGAPRGQLGLGKHIFDEGLPESNVPACAACHGADAHGQDEIPRLAGQLHDYLTSKLANWTRERGQDRARPDISAIMVPTTHNLTHEQIAAVAAYVSTLK